MKNILIIEDTKTEFVKFKNEFSNISNVECSLDISPIFDVETGGFKDVKNYDYVIIHKSFYQNGVSTEIISELIAFVTTKFLYKLIIYSGGSTLENIPTKDQYISYIPREELTLNLPRFIDFSIEIGNWYLLALYSDNYINRFLKASYFKLSNVFDKELALKCLKILGYDGVEISVENQDTVLESIKNKIDE